MIRHLGSATHDSYVEERPLRALAITNAALAGTLGKSEGHVRDAKGADPTAFIAAILGTWAREMDAFRKASRERYAQFAHKPSRTGLVYALERDFEALDDEGGRGRERLFYVAVAWADLTGKAGKGLRRVLHDNREARDADLSDVYGRWLTATGRETADPHHVLRIVTALLEGIYLERRSYGSNSPAGWTATQAADAVLAVMNGTSEERGAEQTRLYASSEDVDKNAAASVRAMTPKNQILRAVLHGEPAPLDMTATTATYPTASLDKAIQDKVNEGCSYRELLLVRTAQRLESVVKLLENRQDENIDTAVFIHRGDMVPAMAPLVAGDNRAYLTRCDSRGTAWEGFGFRDPPSVDVVRSHFDDLWQCSLRIRDAGGLRKDTLASATHRLDSA